MNLAGHYQFDAEYIESLPPRAHSYYVWEKSAHRYQGRFGLRIDPTGRKSFIFRYYQSKKRRFLSLGVFPAMSVTQAKNRAGKLSNSLQFGDDPQQVMLRVDYQARVEEQNELHLVAFSSYLPPTQRTNATQESATGNLI